MPFDLWTDGVTLVDRTVRLFNKTTVARDPMSGIVDGVNTLFYLNHSPVLSSGSVGIYENSNVPSSGSTYAVDYDAGLVTFNTAPTVQPTATYQTARFSDYVLKSLLVAGFDEMEGMWFRGYSLSSEIGTGQILPVTEASAVAYVVDTSGSDPQIGTIYWSQSRNQLNFFAKCVQLAYLRIQLGESALSGMVWTEAQGLRVDKTKVTPNLKLAYDALKDDLRRALNSAQFEFYGTATFGGGVLSPQTREFAAHRFWQGASIAQNWRGNTPYSGDRF